MVDRDTIRQHRNELADTLQNYIIPFWLERGTDAEYGGYLTEFDDKGVFNGTGVKNIVTQARMVWGFSALMPFAKPVHEPLMQEAARQGVTFLLDAFWDKKHGGFYWLLNRDGSIKDPSKLTYGQSFGLYALAQYALTYKDPKALEYAEETFDLLQKYASDTFHGGYYENIEEDWSISKGGAYAGDRKSLDIHLHLMEAYTTLAQVTGKGIHLRKLQESWDIIKTHMVNTRYGYGLNQFDLSFHSLPAIPIMRTWNAERESNEKIENPLDTTSYGHNVELSWLADLALMVLGRRQEDDDTLIIKLLNHAMANGYDTEHGGVYRDGVGTGKALITDKEWWQNWESLTGLINGYVLTRQDQYYNTFTDLWAFVKTHFMNYDVGESRQLLDREGHVIVGNMGNPWKAIYHTGRALAETIKRLDLLLEQV